MCLIIKSLFYTTIVIFLVRSQESSRFDYLSFENFELMRDLRRSELSILRELRDYKSVLEQQKLALEDFLSRRRDSHDLQDFFEHPINAFGGLKKLLINKDRLLKQNNELEERQKAIQGRLEELLRVEIRETDLASARRALILLMDTYKLDLSELNNGNLVSLTNNIAVNNDKGHLLENSDIIQLAQTAFDSHYYDLSIRLLRLIKTEEFSNSTLQLASKSARMNNGHLERRQSIIGKGFQTLGHRVDQKLNPLVNTKGIAEKPIIADFNSVEGSDFLMKQACRGDSLANFTEVELRRSLLKCDWVHHDDPYLKLGPFKREVASKDPFVAVFHDILSENDINFLVNASKPHLSKSRSESLDNAGSTEARDDNTRRRIVSKTVQTWLKDIEYEAIEDVEQHTRSLNFSTEFTLVSRHLLSISKRLELATRMRATSRFGSTDYQVTNYGLGGLCESHIDPHGYIEGAELPPHRQMLRLSGDILATIMAWLNDVEAGGATAFLQPKREVTIWPRKGSAAFWPSLLKDGRRDHHTVHVGCPVLKGSKWILNKWLYVFDQVNEFKCDLRPGTKFNFLHDTHY